MMDTSDVAARVIDARRRVLAWRDLHSIEMPLVLGRAVAELSDKIDEIVANADLRDAWLQPADFIKRKIEPVVAPVIQEAGDAALDRALSDLRDLVEELAADTALYGISQAGHVSGDIADFVSSLAPIAGSIALITAIPAMAVSTVSAGFLGLATATVVSWPVVLGVGSVAAAGVGLGLHRTARFKTRQDGRLRARTDAWIQVAVFGEKAGSPSVLNRLLESINAGSDKALERIRHAAR